MLRVNRLMLGKSLQIEIKCKLYNNFFRFTPSPFYGIRSDSFNIELEKISEEQQTHQFINFSIKLQQHLAMGKYSSVFKAQNESPYDLFNVFLDRISETIR